MLLALSLLSSPALAQEAPAFEPHLQVRPRYELSTGKDGATGGGLMFVTQRSRLGLAATAPHLAARVVVQDVRTWGSELNTLADFTADAFDLHEGWLRWEPSPDARVQLGRQEIKLHEQRLLGAVDWTQQGRAFDGLTGAFSIDRLSSDLGVAVLADADGGTVSTDGLMAFLRAGLAPGEGSAVDLLVVLDTDDASAMTRATGGLYVKAAAGILSGRVEAYGQVGTVGDQAIQAGMVGLQCTISPESELKPKVTAWYDLLSGDADPADDTVRAFHTLYATNHKFYGQLDLITFGLGGAADGQGLHDAALKLSIAPVRPLTVHLDGHLFAAAAPTGDSLLGQEADLWLSGRIARSLSLQGGGAVFLYTADKEPDAWGWLQANLEL